MTATIRAAAVLAALTLIGLSGACSATGELDASGGDTTTTEAEVTTTTEAEETTTTTEPDSPDDRDELLDQIAQGFLDEDDLDFVEPDSARCLAEAFVGIVEDDLGEVTFRDVDRYQMDLDQALEFAAAFKPCDNDLTHLFETSIVESGATSAQAACVVEKFGEKNIELVFAVGMIGGDESVFEDDLTSAAEACT